MEKGPYTPIEPAALSPAPQHSPESGRAEERRRNAVVSAQGSRQVVPQALRLSVSPSPSLAGFYQVELGCVLAQLTQQFRSETPYNTKEVRPTRAKGSRPPWRFLLTVFSKLTRGTQTPLASYHISYKPNPLVGRTGRCLAASQPVNNRRKDQAAINLVNYTLTQAVCIKGSTIFLLKKKYIFFYRFFSFAFYSS